MNDETRKEIEAVIEFYLSLDLGFYVDQVVVKEEKTAPTLKNPGLPYIRFVLKRHGSPLFVKRIWFFTEPGYRHVYEHTKWIGGPSCKSDWQNPAAALACIKAEWERKHSRPAAS